MTVDSEETATKPNEPAGEGSAAMQTPGAMLEHERSRQGLSVQQAAEGLHLDPWIIEAIEANRFLALGAPVYAKGYLRKYATLLGLAPEVVVARYDALTDTLPVPTPVPVITTTPPQRPKWPKYLAWALLAAVVIAIAALAYEFLWPMLEGAGISSVQSTVTAPPESANVAAAPVAIASGPEPASEARGRETAPTLASAEASTAGAAVPVASNAPAVTTASADSMRLTLAFSDSSWVEIYDAAGQRLLYDIGQPGQARTVTGAPPLTVVIGVVAAVKVQVNDRDIVVPRRANRDSARFTVNADGSVQ
jgi:cytoskeleton protein RodZ